MHDQISPGQFRTIYKELTRDCSVSDNKVSKEMDERMQLILSVSDDSILRDLCVNNHRNSYFNDFWAVVEKEIKKMQATLINDRCHPETTPEGKVIVNMSLAVSARHLYEICVKEAKKNSIMEENVPSLTYFRFQFWPKSSSTNAAMNYTE